LRRRFDLYANIRPARSRAGFLPRCGTPVDLVIVRENTEGFYVDRSMHLGPGEYMPTPDLALAARKVPRQDSMRIAEAAFALAMQRRRKVTAAHKTNVLRMSNEAGEIADSLGLAVSLNAGADHAMAQAQHGSAPDIAGKNIANPSSLIGSAAMLLAWLGERRGDERLARAAQAIEAALDRVLAQADGCTHDVGGSLDTGTFAARVAAAIKGS
jgi:3-isopropylmalate dehydrogenase